MENNFKNSREICEYFKNNPNLSVDEMDAVFCREVGIMVVEVIKAIKEDVIEKLKENISGLEEWFDDELGSITFSLEKLDE